MEVVVVMPGGMGAREELGARVEEREEMGEMEVAREREEWEESAIAKVLRLGKVQI